MLSDQSKITLLLADDHAITRAGLRSILNSAPDIQIVGEAENGDEIQKLVAELKPKILLLDLIMPNLQPAELEKWVRDNFPETTTLVLTAHDRDAYLTNMMDEGAAGFITKSETTDRLIDAIRRAAQGEVLFTRDQYIRAQRWREEAGKKWKILTCREHEILRLLANGLDNEEIAEKLSVSPRTIAFHVTNILEKLGVKSRHEAAAWLHKYMLEYLE